MTNDKFIFIAFLTTKKILEAEPDLFDLALDLLPFFLLEISSLGIALACLLILLLLIASAFISSSEVAFFSLSPNDLEKLKSERENVPNTKRLLTLLESPRTLLATILISNNLFNIAIVIVSDYVLRNLITGEICAVWATDLMELFPFLPWSVSFLAKTINLVITVGIVTFALVLFGEVAPKVYAKINNVFLAKFMSFPLSIFQKWFYPLSQMLISLTSIIEKKLAHRTTNNLASKEEIGEAIDLTVKGGINANEEVPVCFIPLTFNHL